MLFCVRHKVSCICDTLFLCTTILCIFFSDMCEESFQKGSTGTSAVNDLLVHHTLNFTPCKINKNIVEYWRPCASFLDMLLIGGKWYIMMDCCIFSFTKKMVLLPTFLCGDISTGSVLVHLTHLLEHFLCYYCPLLLWSMFFSLKELSHLNIWSIYHKCLIGADPMSNDPYLLIHGILSFYATVFYFSFLILTWTTPLIVNCFSENYNCCIFIL